MQFIREKTTRGEPKQEADVRGLGHRGRGTIPPGAATTVSSVCAKGRVQIKPFSTGKERDGETGWIFGARHYRSALGRFTSPALEIIPDKFDNPYERPRSDYITEALHSARAT